LISPTVGRVVLFWPYLRDGETPRDQPFAASVAYVWHDRLINLGYVDQNGLAGAATSIPLLQDDEPAVLYTRGGYAEWIPYQKGQAAKADAKA
jgi:hypothetical protein